MERLNIPLAPADLPPERSHSLKKTRDTLLGYIGLIKSMTHKQLCHQVRYVRVAKAFSQIHKKLEMSFRDGTDSFRIWHQLICVDLQTCTGVSELDGVAPPGDLERQIQGFLGGA